MVHAARADLVAYWPLNDGVCGTPVSATGTDVIIGSRYGLQRKIGGLEGPWADVVAPMMGQPDSGRTMRLELANALGRVYYRLKVQMP